MTSDESAAPLGAVLDGKFRLTQEIGRGGMATVYAAVNIDIGKPVAVKILAGELANSRTVTERFTREARAAARIQSPYICEVYDVGTYQGRPFIVMELLHGESLYDKLARERQLSVSETVQIAVQAARGLKRAHDNNVVHRDLKPENVFLTKGEDGALHTKLVDFGLAKFYEPHQDARNARLTKEGALFGTPAYMSPEQARAKGNVDHRSDLWALACIVYEMVTGRTVWDIDQGVAMILAQIASAPVPQARRYRHDLPEAFDAWLKRALARKPEARIQSADEFITTLEAALGQEALLTPPARSVPPPAPASPPAVEVTTPDVHSQPPETPRARRPLRWSLALLVLVAGAGAWVWFGGGLPFDSLALITRSQPVESTPEALQVSEAQRLLYEQKPDDALEGLRAAFEASQGKAARSLLSHVSVALEHAGGRCQLTGVGHPRPFDSTTESSKPASLETEQGLLTIWADSDQAERTQAQLTLLDPALRRVRALRNVTPEGHTVRDPEIFPTSQGIGLSYWDFAGDMPGAYVRLLDTSGKILTAPTRLGTQTAKHPYYPALAPDGAGNFWAVWVEPSRPRVFDLFVRKLDARLKPLSEPAAVTGYATPRVLKTQAARPSIALANGLLHITYTLRRGHTQHVLLLRVSPELALRGPGVTPEAKHVAIGDEESDRFLGQAIELSPSSGKHDYTTVRCHEHGCLIAWDDAASSAQLAFVKPNGAIAWRRAISPPTGSRPGLALKDQNALVAWFESNRVYVAPVDDGVFGEPSVIGRVSAIYQQPPPLILPATSANRWYVSWRGYEAAVPEPFVAHVTCK